MSDLQSALGYIQMNNYVSLGIVTVVVYDYLLTFSSEVEYVWRRPWTWVSTIFVLVRYLGLTYTILTTITGTTFVPGPAKLHRCTIMYVLGIWAYEIFYQAANLVMILRVYTIWNRSRKILWVLLGIYVPQAVLSSISTGVYNDPNTHISITTVQILDFSVCTASFNNIPPWLEQHYIKIPQFILGGVLLVLAVTQTLKQSVQMYKATKRWQPNQYMEQLVGDGTLYFLVNMFATIASVVKNTTIILFLSLFSYIVMYLIVPRFIIGIRQLYHLDAHRHRQGIDTGFGASELQPGWQASTTMSAVVFAIGDVVSDQESQDQAMEGAARDSEGIRVEMSGDNPLQDV